MRQWIDVTRPMDETLVTWIGRARPQLEWEKQTGSGSHCNVSFWHMSAHSGTHMDAPLHFVDGGKSIDQIPPEVFMGECRVADLTVSGATMLNESAAKHFLGTRRLLIKSPHSVIRSDGRYEPHGPLMTDEAAAALLAHGLVLIGTDRLSVDDSRGDGFTLHRRFLGAGCVIVEGLALAGVAEGLFTLSAMPLRFTGAEASPIRAFLQPATA